MSNMSGKMNNSANRSIVYHTEDLNTLAENIPPSLQAPVTKMMYEMMTHDAYNNGR